MHCTNIVNNLGRSIKKYTLLSAWQAINWRHKVGQVSQPKVTESLSAVDRAEISASSRLLSCFLESHSVALFL